MKALKIYHNPSCSKSRQTLALLQEHGIEPEQRLYLKEPPDEAEIRQLLVALGGDVRQMLRNTEEEYKN
ncbi:MAG TPA: arsenate reductase (glutaredoxin), partial [Pseudohongiella sp.]|nr:arsenate reductase (glutaredoxin) [Pseudohongiella sp.]